MFTMSWSFAVLLFCYFLSDITVTCPMTSQKSMVLYKCHFVTQLFLCYQENNTMPDDDFQLFFFLFLSLLFARAYHSCSFVFARVHSCVVLDRTQLVQNVLFTAMITNFQQLIIYLRENCIGWGPTSTSNNGVATVSGSFESDRASTCIFILLVSLFLA